MISKFAFVDNCIMKNGILLITETKFGPEIESHTLLGNQIGVIRKDRKRGAGGIACLSARTILIKVIDHLEFENEIIDM